MIHLKRLGFFGFIMVLTISSCSMLTDTSPSTEALTQDGWEFFANGYYRSALQSFEDALSQDADYPPAILGKGWTHFMRNENSQAFIEFNTLEDQIDTIPAVYVGRGALHLLDFTSYQLAIQDFNTALALDSTFQFEYKTDIDYRDVRCMKAMAYYRLGNLENAQAEVTTLFRGTGNPTTLNPENPDTWVVDGVEYDSYPEALLRAIQVLVEIFGTDYFI